MTLASFGVLAIESFVGLEWGVFLSLAMFVIFMALILTGYNGRLSVNTWQPMVQCG